MSSVMDNVIDWHAICFCQSIDEDMLSNAALSTHISLDFPFSVTAGLFQLQASPGYLS